MYVCVLMYEYIFVVWSKSIGDEDAQTQIFHNRGICFSSILFICLFGFNVAFKHLRSYRDGACL